MVVRMVPFLNKRLAYYEGGGCYFDQMGLQLIPVQPYIYLALTKKYTKLLTLPRFVPNMCYQGNNQLFLYLSIYYTVRGSFYISQDSFLPFALSSSLPPYINIQHIHRYIYIYIYMWAQTSHLTVLYIRSVADRRMKTDVDKHFRLCVLCLVSELMKH